MTRSGRRTVRSSASSSVGFTPAWARAKIAAAGSRRSSSIAIRASSLAAQPLRARLDEVAHERPVLVQGGPPRRGVLLEREGQLRPLAAEQVEAAEAEAAQGTLQALRTDRHDFPVLRRRVPLLYTLRPVRLTDLGIPKLWKEDTELLWPYALRPGVAVWLLTDFGPGSHGYGLDRVPLEGGLVVAANHFASVDHPLIGIFSPRAIYYMAKKELLDMPIIGELLIWTGAFPVKRGVADREALREGRRLLREGHTVGVHIEGTRQKFGYPGEVKLGGMMIAMQEGAPVIPCCADRGLDRRHGRRRGRPRGRLARRGRPRARRPAGARSSPSCRPRSPRR